jgi:hypothetical protein
VTCCQNDTAWQEKQNVTWLKQDRLVDKYLRKWQLFYKNRKNIKERCLYSIFILLFIIHEQILHLFFSFSLFYCSNKMNRIQTKIKRKICISFFPKDWERKLANTERWSNNG